MVISMAERRGTGGRRSKGPRESLISRVPEKLAHTVRDAADDAGLSINDYIGNLLAEAHGHPPVAPLPSPDQLQMTA